jgi:iron complex transport system ATP-binding protein/vitamin B12 transport system ATP-binding protein
MLRCRLFILRLNRHDVLRAIPIFIKAGCFLLDISSTSLDARLQNISLQATRGQWWFLLGANGAGKSSLLSVIAGLEPAFSGSVSLDGTDIRNISLSKLASARCLVTQAYSTEFSISVTELFSFFTDISICPDLIEQHLDLSTLLNKSFSRLSGGEKQRVHLARNLMQVWPMVEQGEALILLDEPLQQMDIKHQFETLRLFAELQSLGNLLVMSHHDLNHAMLYASHACLLKAGKLIQAGPQQQVLTQTNLEQIFEQRFTKIIDKTTSQSYLIGTPDPRQM